ncbi:PEP phosphonomutase [Caballeronia novacaledonica]|uniref:PEP phosphonomutase n=1 Tax=Caballeronia novacaledonica TaxID=1544861 RepID=A0A2U3I2R5_9BURK|nr:PEP phosphonomutase [Caballeronia novacaledonica]
MKQPQEAIARGNLYASAGADGLFLPALVRLSDIEAIVGATRLPLNVMAFPGLPDAATLGKLGVRRLSAGSAISQVLLGRAKAMTQDFLAHGRSESLDDNPLSYAEIQRLFA